MVPIKTKEVESSNIAAIGYDPASKTLQVDFKRGKRFQYPGVEPGLFAEFEKAESVGKFFATHIKPQFDGVPLEETE